MVELSRRNPVVFWVASLLMLYLSFLAGRFSLYRLSPDAVQLGLAGEVRFWMIGVLFVGAVMMHVRLGRRFTNEWASTLRWLLLVELLLAFAAVSILWSPAPSASFLGFTNLISLAVLLAATPLVLLPDPQRGIRVILQFTFWTAVIYFVAGASGIWRDGLRWSAFEGGANVFVRILASGAIAAVYLWRSTGSLRFMSAVPLFTIGVLSSGSRGGLLAAMFGYPLTLWMLGRSYGVVLTGLTATLIGIVIVDPLSALLQQARVWAVAIAMGLSALSTNVALPSAPPSASESPASIATRGPETPTPTQVASPARTEPSTSVPDPTLPRTTPEATPTTPLSEFWWQRFIVLSLGQRYLADRDRLYGEGVRVFVEHPVVGVGVDGFASVNELREPYPHNLILLVASETGMVGLLLLFLTIPALVRRWTRPMALEHKAALCLALYYLSASMVSGGWYDARFMWLGFLMYMTPARDRARAPEPHRVDALGGPGSGLPHTPS